MTTTKAAESDILKNAMARVESEQNGGAAPAETPLTPQQKAAKTKAAKAAAKAAKTTVADAPAQPAKKSKTAMVAYTPLEDGDPNFTIFFGMKFKANLAREVSDPELIAKAKTNPWFSVDGKSAPRNKKPPPRDEDIESARSGLPDGLDPEKHEVEMTGDDGEEVLEDVD